MRVMLGGDHWMLILRRTFPTKPSNFQCLINISAPKKTQKLGEKLLQGITEWKLAGLPQCTARVYNTHTQDVRLFLLLMLRLSRLVIVGTIKPAGKHVRQIGKFSPHNNPKLCPGKCSQSFPVGWFKMDEFTLDCIQIVIVLSKLCTLYSKIPVVFF